jgi:hypothetical protein
VIVRLGVCDVCGRSSMTRHTGARWACAWCWPNIEGGKSGSSGVPASGDEHRGGAESRSARESRPAGTDDPLRGSGEQRSAEGSLRVAPAIRPGVQCRGCLCADGGRRLPEVREALNGLARGSLGCGHVAFPAGSRDEGPGAVVEGRQAIRGTVEDGVDSVRAGGRGGEVVAHGPRRCGCVSDPSHSRPHSLLFPGFGNVVFAAQRRRIWASYQSARRAANSTGAAQSESRSE